jgi:hypothetical protein
MIRRPLRRAAVLSLGVLLAFAGTAAADSVTADNVAPIVSGSHFLGDAAPGGTVSADVRFAVICAGLQHIDPNQSVILTGNGGIVPLDGAIVSISTATLTPLSIPWGADGQGCPDPVPSYTGSVSSHVVLRAPTTAGTHTFTGPVESIAESARFERRERLLSVGDVDQLLGQSPLRTPRRLSLSPRPSRRRPTVRLAGPQAGRSRPRTPKTTPTPHRPVCLRPVACCRWA